MATELRVIPSAPEGESVVDLLENTLERARAGEFSCLAVVYVDREGCSGSGWSRVTVLSSLIGALEYAKLRIMGGLE